VELLHVAPQTPLEHTWPARQTLPQDPQLLLSVAVVAQNGLPPLVQNLWLAPHEVLQLPLLQT
jgi:hypothetical protein